MHKHLNQTTKDWYTSSVTLSETKGLSERFFALLLRNKMPNPYHPLDSSFRWNDENTRPSFRASNARPGIQEYPVSASTLSAPRYGRLRMTGVRGHAGKYTNVIWFDLAITLMLSLALSACSLTPGYLRPQMDIPEGWSAVSNTTQPLPTGRVSLLAGICQ